MLTWNGGWWQWKRPRQEVEKKNSLLEEAGTQLEIVRRMAGVHELVVKDLRETSYYRVHPPVYIYIYIYI